MASTLTHHPPLLIEWTPTAVRVFDPVTRASKCADSISEALHAADSGRHVVVAVSQRSAYIRTLAVPNVAVEEMSRLVGVKLGPLLPFKPGEYVHAFRLADVRGAGRMAVAAAMKTESLRRIYRECEGGGLRVAAVLPLAFGSWLAARASSLTSCAVVETGDDSLAIDVIGSGELCYSRSVSLPDTTEELEEEIFRTLSIAGTPTAVVLGDPSLSLRDQHMMTKEPLEYLADLHAIQRQLFSFELPEKLKARKQKGVRGAATRAIAMSVLAAATAAFVYARQSVGRAELAKVQLAENAELTRAQVQNSAAIVANHRLIESSGLLHVAFKPAQTLSDVATVIAGLTPKDVWFTGLTVERGKPVLIRGVTSDGKAIADFVSAFGKDPRFRSMRVVSATKSTVGKTPVIEFAVSGIATGLLPIDQLVSREPAKQGTATPEPKKS